MSLKRNWSNRKITPVMKGKTTKTSKKLRVKKLKLVFATAIVCFTAYSLITLSNAIVLVVEPTVITINEVKLPPTIEEVKAEIVLKANLFNLDAEKMLKLANCESGFDYKAKNKKSTARGVYQYLIGTWEETQSAKQGKERNDYKANIHEAMLDVANGEAWRWRDCRVIADL